MILSLQKVNGFKSKGTILYFQKYDENKQELFEVEFLKQRNSNIKQIVHAGSAYFDDNIGNWVFTGCYSK